MRFRSKRQAGMYRAHCDARKAYLLEHDVCAACGNWATEVHELANGPNRAKAFGVRAAYMSVCTTCNQTALTDKQAWPLEKQLAAKLLQDPAGFDLDTVRKVYAVPGKPVPVKVMESEVLEATRQLLMERSGA